MFRIKICGITKPRDAKAAVEAGADAIGLNFCPSSPRLVSMEGAAEIVGALPSGVAKVGVFVNMPAQEVCARFDRLGLDWIQLHGDEPPQFLSALGDRRVLRALRVGPDGIAPAERYLAACRDAGRLPQAVLIDAHVPGQYGGTGQAADWGMLAEPRLWLMGLPLVLAGGLTPENVAEAIAAVRPDAVDVASGVESSAGWKDPERMARFVAAARSAAA